MEHLSLKQLKLYNPDVIFTVRCVNLNNGKVRSFKDINLDMYVKYLKYLQHLNIDGYNIYFFPRAKRGAVDFLLDDVSLVIIKQLESDNLKPFYFLETSKSNYQIILRFDTQISNKEQYLEINKYLVGKYHADPGSTGTEHYFRLAGFTNRKEKYMKNGIYPFVKLYAVKNIIDERLLPKINIISQENKNKETTTALPCVQGKNNNCFNYIRTIYLNNNKNISDLSRLDFKVSIYALQKHFDESEIKNAIKILSPDLKIRHAGDSRLENYLNTTLMNARKKLT